MVQTKLSVAEWTKVVGVAGVGTVLEWVSGCQTRRGGDLFDFYIYAQLRTLLLLPTPCLFTPPPQLWWAVYAVGFVVRPLGALIFGHIGDTWGRNTTLRIAIVCMAIPTVVIGCLPTYDVGPYTAGLAAPILLTIMRLLQGLAMGGEFGPAIIYLSELAPVSWRGRLVACLQMAVNIGMILATLLVMLLENTTTTYEMQVWGWRIPFCLAFAAAILGYWLRRGLPEPKTFLAAARSETEGANKVAMANGELSQSPSSAKEDDAASVAGSVASSSDLSEEAFSTYEPDGPLSWFHGNHSSKASGAAGCVPILRLLLNNWMGLAVHILYMAWVSAAFYATVTWLPDEMRDAGLKHIVSQGIVVVSMLTNAAGLFACGTAFDKGWPAIYINLAITLVGMSIGFGVFRGMWWQSAALDVNSLAAWFLMPLFQGLIGIAMASVVLPATRIYAPLERTTGFSFGYNCGYGVIGGLTPFAVSGIIDSLGADKEAYAPAFWLLGLGGASVLGCLLCYLYGPRLNKPYVGRIE
ncbi:hypothetical protein ABPG75_005207 [Micractinium tetrahymenae]